MANKKNTANTSIKQTAGFGKEYYDWVWELSSRYRQSQIKAAVRVNSEMLRFYWSVGKDIEERQFGFYSLYHQVFFMTPWSRFKM